MKFGQLIEHEMRNIFFIQNHTKNVVEKLVKPFYKKQNFSISQDQQSEMLWSLLLL